MDEQRKHAYRWLLYQAMLTIRPLQWIGGRWRQRLNPFCWWSCSRLPPARRERYDKSDRKSLVLIKKL